MSIGAPGSGKTTLLEKFKEKLKFPDEYITVSPDEIRKEKFGDAPFDPAKNEEVWLSVNQKVQGALADGKSVIVDATFANIRQRREFISKVREFGAEKVQGIFLDVPLEVALDRNKQRGEAGGKFVDEKAVIGMTDALDYNEPGLIDGFDSIFQVDSNHELIQVDMLEKDRKYITKEFK